MIIYIIIGTIFLVVRLLEHYFYIKNFHKKLTIDSLEFIKNIIGNDYEFKESKFRNNGEMYKDVIDVFYKNKHIGSFNGNLPSCNDLPHFYCIQHSDCVTKFINHLKDWPESSYKLD